MNMQFLNPHPLGRKLKHHSDNKDRLGCRDQNFANLYDVSGNSPLILLYLHEDVSSADTQHFKHV